MVSYNLNTETSDIIWVVCNKLTTVLAATINCSLADSFLDPMAYTAWPCAPSCPASGLPPFRHKAHALEPGSGLPFIRNSKTFESVEFAVGVLYFVVIVVVVVESFPQFHFSCTSVQYSWFFCSCLEEQLKRRGGGGGGGYRNSINLQFQNWQQLKSWPELAFQTLDFWCYGHPYGCSCIPETLHYTTLHYTCCSISGANESITADRMVLGGLVGL